MAYLRFLKPLLISTTVIAVLEVCFAAVASALLLWSMTLLDPPANLPLQFPTRAAAVVFAIASLRPVVLTAAQWIVYKKHWMNVSFCIALANLGLQLVRIFRLL